MPDGAQQPIHHDAHLGTGNGVIQFVCCRTTDQPYDMLWTGPGGKWAANVFHSPRQAYDSVAAHLTQGHDDATRAPLLETAEGLITQVPPSEEWMKPRDDVRASIQHLADHLDNVTLTVRNN